MTIKEFKKLNTNDHVIIDVRDNTAFNYGNIPGSRNIPLSEIKDHITELAGKKVILYCKRGEASSIAADELTAAGIDAVSLEEGYMGWLMSEIGDEDGDEEEHRPTCAEIEESIRKKFHKSIFCKFTKAVREYELVKPGDSICVCISGGKDSMLMAKCFQELKRHNKFEFEVKFLIMDPGYSPENRKLIEKNAERLGIPAEYYESDIFDSVFNVVKSPCYLCARMRRGHLYSKAREMGCNKIALGHHYDDVIETILMGMLYGAQIQTMMPKLHSTNFEGMELIRPLYYVREDDIKAWRDYNKLHFIQCACKFTDTCSSCDSDGQSESSRLEVKKLIREMKKTNQYVESNIFNSVTNVNLSTVIAYKQHGIMHNFLDDYDDIKDSGEQEG